MSGKRREFHALAQGEAVELSWAETEPKKIRMPDEEGGMDQAAQKNL